MSRSAWTAVIAVVVVVLVLIVIASGFIPGRGGYGWGMMGPGMMGGWGMMLLGPILLLLLLALLIGGVVWAVQAAARGGMSSGGGRIGGETSLEILKRRYASGEITNEEFEAMRRAIEQ